MNWLWLSDWALVTWVFVGLTPLIACRVYGGRTATHRVRVTHLDWVLAAIHLFVWSIICAFCWGYGMTATGKMPVSLFVGAVLVFVGAYVTTFLTQYQHYQKRPEWSSSAS